MALNNWTNRILFFGLLWSLGVADPNCQNTPNKCQFCVAKDPMPCNKHNAMYLVMVNDNSSLIFADDFSKAFCNGSGLDSIIFLNKTTFPDVDNVKKKWPEVEKRSNSLLLSLTKWHITNNLKIYVLLGENCSAAVNQTSVSGTCESNPEGTCQMKCLKTNDVCKQATYNNAICMVPQVNDKYFLNVTTANCTNCDNPVKDPKTKVDLGEAIPNITKPTPNEPVNPDVANQVMNSMSELASKVNESRVAMSLGESVTGILLKQTDPQDMEEVSFGYTAPNESFNILEDRKILDRFSRSVTVSKEAFQKALDLNITVPFAAVFRFLNLSKDEYNSSVLGDEVIAIEMGAIIKNLTDTININFWNMKYTGIPTCHSWKGNGPQPNWTDDGCNTVIKGKNVTCRCTHMTFFAILLTPLNETISTYDLNTLTTITRVGLGLSMFFLGIVLFMHFVLRRARSSDSTKILIHLVLAMFLLDFSFLINDFVAKMKNVIGCKIMGALMHYFMLTTFTWFAVHAFHLCLQLHSGGKIEIHRYVLKVSITSWVMPSIIAIVLLSIGKYGEEVITTDSVSVGMCWITDNSVHYIVNIGYYALVFVFTFSTFVVMLNWLYCMKRNQKAAAQGRNGTSCQRIVTIMGLCCILGVTWGCAFFAYGIFRVPAYYAFTILNSFQGFCLFIFYYKTSRMVETKDPSSSSSNSSSSSSSSSSTLKTNLDEIFNPYDNYITKPTPK